MKPPKTPMTPKLGAAVTTLLVLLAGCGAPPGGGSGGSAAAASTGTGPGAGFVNAAQTHWQTALAALGSSAAPIAPTFEQPAMDDWSDLVAQTWPELRKIVDAAILRNLTQQVGQFSGGGQIVGIRNLRNIVLDTSAPLGFATRPGGATAQIFRVELPRPPGSWRVSFTVDVAASYSTRIAGFPISAIISVDVTADVSDARIEQEAVIDTTNPVWPKLGPIAQPSVSLRIAFSSSDPLAQQLMGALTSILDPVVRAAILGGAIYAQQQVVQLLSGLPQVVWGTGGSPCPPVPGAAPLEPLALEISDIIQQDHLPFDTLIPCYYSSPVYRQGNVTSYEGHGDSPIWTGHYVTAELLRYEVTRDPRALQNAERGLHGIEGCLALMSNRYDGLLSRGLMLKASPFHRDMNPQDPEYHTGFFEGREYASYGDISRDQYLGAFMAATEAYLRVPAWRPKMASLLTRMVEYFRRNGWNVFMHNDPQKLSRAAPLSQTPGVVCAFLKAAYTADPQRWGALHDQWKELSSLMWFNTWGSALEVHESYYKFNLGHAQLVILTTCETDPTRYRDYVKSHDIDRTAIGHHDNAWFDAVAGAVVPALASTMGTRVKNELDHWALRPRRGFTALNSQDPAIAQASYNAQTISQGPITVAVLPIPIEKRPPADFLWQRGPFGLDGGEPPTHQAPGVDMILPYWWARAYGFLP